MTILAIGLSNSSFEYRFYVINEYGHDNDAVFH